MPCTNDDAQLPTPTTATLILLSMNKPFQMRTPCAPDQSTCYSFCQMQCDSPGAKTQLSREVTELCSYACRAGHAQKMSHLEAIAATARPHERTPWLSTYSSPAGPASSGPTWQMNYRPPG